MKKIKGLNTYQVKERVEQGLSNIKADLPTRTIAQILKSNLFTVFNAINLGLALLVFMAGSPRNALFAIVIVSNTAIGIIQELRARSTLAKLSILNTSKSQVIRDGAKELIGCQDIVVDDIVVLNAGDQILADGFLVEGEQLSVDESSLTGESEQISKSEGDLILSGSYVSSGYGYMKVTHVSSNTYISKLSDEAKQFKPVQSELKSSINRIVKAIVWLIFPLGALLTASQMLFSDKPWRESLLSSVAGISGMIPEGLVLLTTVAFLVGLIRLSKWNTLVQDLPATETLARVDTICLDKTGTLTEGILKVSDIVPLSANLDFNLEKAIASTVHSFSSENNTQRAIMSMFPTDPGFSIDEKIPFCSEKKWSGIKTSDGNIFVLGAPELILSDGYGELLEKINTLASSGKRVLLFSSALGPSLNCLQNLKLTPSALIVLEDRLRDEAVDTIGYFEEQGLDVKIISGDNPVTVSAISSKAGVRDALRYYDARNLPRDRAGIVDVLKEYNVFGRVTPHQKRDLIQGLKQMGRTVAMTGDGVNDILALKESDCGIALSSGSESTKAVAQIVLLDSNFSNLPRVILEGRKIINNLERVASLYLTKTFYSIFLSLIFAITLKPYPFIPIQLTLLGSLAIGVPSFFLAFSPNECKVGRGFLYRVLSSTIPKGMVVALSTFISFMIGLRLGLALEGAQTLSILVAGGISFIVLFKTARPLNLSKITLISTVISIFLLAFISPLGRSIFSLSVLGLRYILIGLFLVGISYFIMDIGSYTFRKLLPQK